MVATPAAQVHKWPVAMAKKLSHADGPHIEGLSGDRVVEWSWVATRIPSGPGEALDFGPGDKSYLSLILARKGFNVLALDRQPVNWPFSHPSIHLLLGDILEMQPPRQTFDVVVSCSTVEHVGLKGRFGTISDTPDGDLVAMRRLGSWMKPSGLMILTIPVGRDADFPPLHRVYGELRLPRLLGGYEVEDSEFWVKKDGTWTLAPEREALAFVPSVAHPRHHHVSMYALGCFALRRG